MAKIVKGRDWTFLVYPTEIDEKTGEIVGGAPINWREILDETHLRWVESPFHDKDVNPDGTPKKPHWHILLTWDGPVTFEAAAKITKELNSPVPQKVGSARGLVRYMAHLDNPEKFQYSVDEIIGHGGADVAEYFKMTATNRMTVLKDMVRYIYDNGVDNFADFLMICIENSDDWFEVATNHNTLAINKMIDGVWQKNRVNQSKE